MTAEDKIREQRLVEATQKDYIGKGGKLGCILKTLGEPIKSHASQFFESTPYEDPWLLPEDEDEIPTLDEDESVTTIGLIFDGLRHGRHIEIKFLDDELKVHYKGYLVYQEVAGSLECFVPHEEWEGHIEELYKVALLRKRKHKKEKKQERKEQTERAKNMWLDRMWRKWGFK
jgi:hypothetical protein